MWNVIYVGSRKEKKVAQLLERDGVTYFLPLIKTKRQWSDRVKLVEVPLFNSYVFVQSDLMTRDKILQTPGVVKFLKYNSQYAQVPDEVISSLQKALAKGYTFINAEEVTAEAGQSVSIVAGPFKGFSGTVLSHSKSNYVLINLEVIDKQICVKIEKNYLKDV